MQIEETALPGVLILTPAPHGDTRDFFLESWNLRTLEEAGVHLPQFVQDNHSLSAKAGPLRGLHYQAPPHEQGKLVRCGRGALYDPAVDGRRGSATYGLWVGVDSASRTAAISGCRRASCMTSSRGWTTPRSSINARAITTRRQTGRLIVCCGKNPH